MIEIPFRKKRDFFVPGFFFLKQEEFRSFRISYPLSIAIFYHTATAAAPR